MFGRFVISPDEREGEREFTARSLPVFWVVSCTFRTLPCFGEGSIVGPFSVQSDAVRFAARVGPGKKSLWKRAADIRGAARWLQS